MCSSELSHIGTQLFYSFACEDNKLLVSGRTGFLQAVYLPEGVTSLYISNYWCALTSTSIYQ